MLTVGQTVIARLDGTANGLVGNASDNFMVGNNAGVASTLSGLAGNDTISARRGR